MPGESHHDIKQTMSVHEISAVDMQWAFKCVLVNIKGVVSLCNALLYSHSLPNLSPQQFSLAVKLREKKLGLVT